MAQGKRKTERKTAQIRHHRLVKEAHSAGARATPAPSWRQVEALRERRALKNELSDIWSEDPELDESIFFNDKESRRFYQRPGRLNDDDFEIDEEAIPDDED